MLSSVTAGEFVLTSAERDQLRAWTGEGSRLAVRARIVLACSEPGVVYARLADELGVSVMTVHNVRRRFFESRWRGWWIGLVRGGRRPACRCRRLSVISCSVGRGGRVRPRRWRCGRRSFWRVPTDPPTPGWQRSYGSGSRRWRSGVAGSWTGGWRVWSMSPDPGGCQLFCVNAWE